MLRPSSSADKKVVFIFENIMQFLWCMHAVLRAQTAHKPAAGYIYRHCQINIIQIHEENYTNS